MNNLSTFSRFAKSGHTQQLHKDVKTAVVYTRVSGKEQFDKNLSLECQKKAIEEYASRSEIKIAGYFGGTYESAKTDGRKEFQRMLEFIKKNNGKISHVLVFMLDRFSRTGGGAIKLAEDLRNKYGVEIYAVAQPTDTSHPSGIFQQNIHFIFSQYDNELRKQRALTGMKEKFNRGIWIAKPPIGYDIVKTNGVRSIVINSTGKKIRKAFVWKSEGMKNEQILSKLRSMGLPLAKQHLTKILKNPFYCGLLSHAMLDGKIVEGTHEKLISRELFLTVNEIHENNAGYGVSHKRQQDDIPLKVFVRCSECNTPFTGYIVKSKNLWYYKCRTIGCKCNRSAKEMHAMFIELLEGYSIQEHLKAPLLKKLESKWMEINKESYELEESYRKQQAELKTKIENIEESYFVTKEMNKVTYDKFFTRYNAELQETEKQISKLATGISNPLATLEGAIRLSLNLATEWTSSDIDRKEKLQKLVFPEGIVYDKENKVFRTEKVNSIFCVIGGLASVSGKNEKRQTGGNSCLSPSVRAEGLEPPYREVLDPKSSVSTNFTTPAA